MPTLDRLERLSTFTSETLQAHQAADLMRALSVAAFTPGGPVRVADEFAHRWPHAVSKDLVTKAFTYQTKAAVSAGTTTDSTWAAPLMPAELVGAFMPLVTAQSALLRLPLARVPFDVRMSLQTADASYAWIPENGVKPISTFAFTNTASVSHYKSAGTVVLTRELVRLATPGSVPAMQRQLSAGLAAWLDQQFLDPSKAGVAGTNPPSITHGLTPVTVSGTLAQKVATLVGAFFAALPGASAQTTLVMSPATASLLASSEHPNITAAGGTAFGLAVVTTPAVGATVAILDPMRVLCARDEQPQLRISDEAAVEMSTTPGLTDPIEDTVLVSFFQMNLVGIRSEMAAAWLPLPNSVAYAVVS